MQGENHGDMNCEGNQIQYKLFFAFALNCKRRKNNDNSQNNEKIVLNIIKKIKFFFCRCSTILRKSKE